MFSVTRTAVAAVVLGAATITAVAPADAQRWRDRYHHRDRTGAIIGAGIIGLGVGAAIASANRGYYGCNYGPSYGYGYPPPPRYGYYGGPRYYGGYGHGYRPRCYTRRVYDPYIGRRVRVRYCD